MRANLEDALDDTLPIDPVLVKVALVRADDLQQKIIGWLDSRQLLPESQTYLKKFRHRRKVDHGQH